MGLLSSGDFTGFLNTQKITLNSISQRQSPINIVTSSVQYNPNLKVETFNFDTAPMTMKLKNNGENTFSFELLTLLRGTF